MERAEVFDELEMINMAQNAVLIYVGYKNHLCAIVIKAFINLLMWLIGSYNVI